MWGVLKKISIQVFMVVKMLKKVCCIHIAQGKIRCSFLEIHFLPTLKQSFEDQIISFLSSFGHFCAALSSRKKPSQTGAYVAVLAEAFICSDGSSLRCNCVWNTTKVTLDCCYNTIKCTEQHSRNSMQFKQLISHCNGTNYCNSPGVTI